MARIDLLFFLGGGAVLIFKHLGKGSCEKRICWKAHFWGVRGKNDIKVNGAGEESLEDRRDFREAGCQTEAG